MSIVIEGLNLPQKCECCVCCQYDEYEVAYCEAGGTIRYISNPMDNRLPECPLIAIPTPHGRLIDADRLEDRIKNMVGKYDTAIPLNVVYRLIAGAHPIIEAEE